MEQNAEGEGAGKLPRRPEHRTKGISVGAVMGIQTKRRRDPKNRGGAAYVIGWIR